MADIAELGFRVDSRGILVATKELDKLDKAGDRVGKTGARTGGLIERSMQQASGGIVVAERSSRGLSTQLSGMKAAVAGLGLAALARSAIGMGAAFDASMNTVQSKLLLTTDAMEVLRDQAKDLGATTAFSASQAADGMGFLAQAGLDAEQIMSAMPHTLNLASAAQLDLAQSADIATNVMGAFRHDVDQLPAIVDMLALTSAKANTSVAELAGGIKTAGPVAAGFGVSMHETSAALGILANNGIKSTEAGMVLKNMLANLAAPAGQAEKSLDALGLSTGDFYDIAADGTLTFKGFSSALELLEQSGAGATEMIQIFGREAGPGALALTGSVDQIDELAGAIQQSGAAAEMAATNMQGLPGVIKSAASAWEALNIAFVELGGADLVITALQRATEVMRFLAKDGAEYLSTAIEGLSRRWEAFKVHLAYSDDLPYRALRDIGSAIEAIGEYLKLVLPYLDEFGGAFVAVGAGVAAASLAISGIGAAVALLTSPLAIIGALGAAAYLIYDNWDGIVAWWDELWSDVTAAAGDALGWFEREFPLVFGVMSTQVKAAGKVLEGDFAGAWDAIVAGAEDFGAQLVNTVASLGELLYDVGARIIEWLADGIAAGADRVKQSVTGVVDTVVDSVTGGVSGMVEAGKDTALGYAEGITGWFGEVAVAAKGLVGTAVETTKTEADIHSPSRVMMELGGYISEGFAVGITNSAGLVVEAVGDLTKKGQAAFERIKQSLDEEILGLVQGEEALERYKLAQEGVTGEKQDFIVALRDARDAAQEEQREIERAEAQMQNLAQAQAIQNARLTEGEAAARALELSYRGGYTPAMIESAVATEQAMETQREFHGALVDSITNADSIKDAFGNLGDWLKDWLKEKIAHFATNKLMVWLGVGGEGEATGLLSGFFGKLRGMFGGGASSSGIFSQALGGLRNALGFGSQQVTQITARMSEFGAAAGTTGTAASSAASGFAAAAGPMLAIAGAAAVFNSALGGTSQKVADGFKVGYESGSVVGNDVAFWEKERSLWRGTKTWEVLSDLSTDIRDHVQSYIDTMHTSIISTASALGVEGAQSIMDGYSLAIQTFRGEDAGEQLQEYLTQSTADAYRLAYDELGPVLQAHVRESTGAIEEPVMELAGTMQRQAYVYEEGNIVMREAVDAHNASIDRAIERYEDAVAEWEENSVEMQELMEEMARAAVFAVPALEGLGFALGETRDESIVTATRLSEAFGGVESMMDRLTFYAQEFVPSGQAVSTQVLAATEQLRIFSEGLGLSSESTATTTALIGDLRAQLDLTTPAGQAANAELAEMEASLAHASDGIIDTREELYRYVEALQAQYDAGLLSEEQLGEMTAAALANMEAIIAVEDAMRAQQLVLETVEAAATKLNLTFGDQSPVALGNAYEAVVNLMGGLDQFTAATDYYFQEYFSLQEQQDYALAQTAGAVHDFNNTLGLSGDQLIDTKAELRTYIESLDLSTEAGQRAYAQALEIARAMAELDGTGQDLQSVIDALPEHLRASFGEMTEAGDNTAGSMTENANVIDVATATTESSFGSLANAMTFLANASSAAAGTAAGAAQAAARQATAAYNEAIAAGASHAEAILAANGAYSEQIDSAASAQSAADSAAAASSAASSASSAANSANSAMTAAERAMARILADLNNRDGSHANGLYRVPFDGYIAELHAGERVLTAAEAAVYNRTEVSNYSAPVSPIAAQPSRGDNREMVAELRAVRRELEGIKRENREAARANAAGHAAVAGNTGRRLQQADEHRRGAERDNRKIAKAVAG